MRHTTTIEVTGPWSLRTGKRFWEGFTPAAIPRRGDPDALYVSFLSEYDWTAVTATVTQHENRATVTVSGDGDLDAAAGQVARFLSLDVDATGWPAIGGRDPVIAAAREALPGFRPCGFTSPYEAAAWAVLSQRTSRVVAAGHSRRLSITHGREGVFPAPSVLIRAIESGELTLPGRKADYLAAVAGAAADGVLDARRLRALPEDDARAQLREISGIGPFGADLVLIRGAGTADVLPRAEPRLDAEITRRYGPGRGLGEVARAWRPFRSWAAVHLRATAAAPIPVP
ncbi:DNA-3-methyladenine glycosylase family protein [Amycolatopsis jiangsuensis]|uniref:DNA-3-methyladenine glycosylase II n=1 Tax=Amycolatopsis jiangsuensis TaxID=1181879 RepID=A0A840IPY7_9PSEU|nr:DNA-3-methyladenine glycosylase 2 family protein [Amycolatopsis jiangsuensis]MBB4683923.1 DNA-3-methyladenine glycosylase II [Amycolatopsis jiangsuensis]